MTYVKQTWTNGAGGGTPLSADRLNHVEIGLETVSLRVNSEGPLSLLDPRVGADPTGVTDSTVALNTALTLVDSVGGEIYGPAGTYLTSGWDFGGKKGVFRGSGHRTIIKAIPGITRSVISLEGWLEPSNGIGTSYFGDFAIEGDNASDSTKTHYGLVVTGVAGANLNNISIQKTGGAGFYTAGGNSFGTWSNITLGRPIDADINNVPYAHFQGYVNGITLINWGFRSTTSSPDGMAVWKVEHGGGFTPHDSTVLGAWLEFQHVPEGGAIFDFATNGWVIQMPEVFDIAQVSGATDTCVLKLRSPSSTNQGGNDVWGLIYGRSTGALNVRYGVVIAQNGNAVHGVRGYKDNNVRLDAGVSGCYVALGGELSTASGSGIIDNSGTNDNTLFDASAQYLRFRNLYLAQSTRTSNSALLQVGETAGVGGVVIGPSGGPSIFVTASIIDRLFYDASRHTLRGMAGGVIAEFLHDGTNPKVGFNGVAAVAKRTLGAAATDAATTQTLANNLRQALIDLGLGQT